MHFQQYYSERRLCCYTHTRTLSAWVRAIDRSDNVSCVCRLASLSHLFRPSAISAKPRLISLQAENQTHEIKLMRRKLL